MITAVCPNPSVDKMYRLHSVNPGVNRCTDTQSYPGGKGVHVALTDGANGLFLAFKNRYYHAICPVDEVISTVGAGDCLTAGILHAQAGRVGNEFTILQLNEVFP